MTVEPSLTGNNIYPLIRSLGSDQLGERKKARTALIGLGKSVVPSLIPLLASRKVSTRWEAAFILGEIHDPSAVPALVKALEDDTVEVRWRAAEGLIQMKQNALIPLFERLKERFKSVLLREGAHHVLHCLDHDGLLTEPSINVLKSLESIEPASTVPWAVERALEVYNQKGVAAPKGPDLKKEEEDFILRLLIDNPRSDEE